MKILIGCEESQVVCKAFRAKGHEAYSCDIAPCSGGRPDWHIQKDIRLVLGYGIWDMGIFFPPCTDLCVSGAKWFEQKKQDGRQQAAIDFFMLFVDSKIPNKAIENPIGIMSRLYRKPDQIIQPWQFGHMEQKSTCLWLTGLPLLKPTNIVKNEMMELPRNKRERLHYLSPGPERAKLRSKTFEGIGKAMATQWG